ncbi:MAG TPA: hypothetical protein VI979_04325 [archaeon]|nr:hypothetical protein [archaeon]
MNGSGRGYVIENGTIVIQRKLTQLDEFVQKFVRILEKHSDYLIVSGYVSISTGRTRGTEDVDIIFPVAARENFRNLFEALTENGFWCYQRDNWQTVYDYIKNMAAVRFATKKEMFPNIELIPFDEAKKAKHFEFTHPQKIRICDFEFKIPEIAFEILYKEMVLKGKKDIEDAKHLRAFFTDIINQKKLKSYKPLMEHELHEA